MEGLGGAEEMAAGAATPATMGDHALWRVVPLVCAL